MDEAHRLWKRSKKKIDVLIAGADPMVMHIVERCVRGQGGFELVGGVFNSTDMRRVLRSASPDLVILEPAMSPRRPLEAVRIVQRESIAMMIGVSRISNVVAIDSILGYRVFDFILKPFGIDRLVTSIEAFRKFFEYRSRLSGRVYQEEVDKLLTERRLSIVGKETPKGLQRECLSRIFAAFETDPFRTMSVADAMQICHISRSTAWRYLEYLVTDGVLSKTPSYKPIGRPVSLYRRVGQVGPSGK